MMKKKSSWAWGTVTVGILLIFGILDWYTGHELNFLVFYFIPVFIATWFFGLIVSVTLAIICAMVWFAADHLSGHTYTSSIYAVWNTLIRLISFLVIVWCVAKVRDLLNRERQTAETLRRSLSEIKILETFLPICAQCKKIRNKQGEWQHLEDYFGQHANAKFSHGYCPECARKTIAEAGLTDKGTQKGDESVR